MSTTARLLTTAVIASVLSGAAVPLASTAFAATGPAGIGWDVPSAKGIGWDAPSAHAAVSATGVSANGIGWD
ncbi:hypothetical protein ABZ924_08070 [Streptomyces sp. NPDC046876]|uniref:hypothetical protein n=1 Tax=Streptomyces sp. NPDC046876 TaxID=3155616 RepID=UPI0033F59DA8